MEPTPGRFHALARSSPWRWSTLRFTWVPFTGPDGHRPRATTSPVRAHLRRPSHLGHPAHLRIEDLDGTVREITEHDPRVGEGRLTRLLLPGEEPPSKDDDGSAVEEATEPTFDDDGFVATRPGRRARAEDPMWDNYAFVAALDPVELADGDWIEHGPAARGTEVEELRVVEHHGRTAWEALVHPTADYEPRCSCCSLLFTPASLLGEQEPGLEFPDAHWVRLDLETGVCVVAEQLGGSHAGSGHEMVIEAVDEPMGDDLFPDLDAPRTWRWPWQA